MVAKWSNPSCSASFRYLEEGRLFRLEKDPAPRSSKVAAAKYFWLCPSCSSTMTLHLSEDGSVIPVVLREPVHNSGDFWWQAWQKNSCCVIKPPCNAGAKESCPSLQVGREVGFRNYRLKASQSSRCCAPRRVPDRLFGFRSRMSSLDSSLVPTVFAGYTRSYATLASEIQIYLFSSGMRISQCPRRGGTGGYSKDRRITGQEISAPLWQMWQTVN